MLDSCSALQLRIGSSDWDQEVELPHCGRQ